MDPQAIQHFFGPDGPLARALSSADGSHAYEERGEQRDLAIRVGAAISQGSKLIAEAGTGTGKTLAYLVPALASGLKVVVSTGTKNLQDQLLHQDLPLVERATGHRFDVVVMKGRQNYLCEARLERATAQGRLPGLPDAHLLETVLAWRQETHSGERAELGSLADRSDLWRELSVTSEQCPGRKCSHFENCWITRVRRRALECELLVVNHHLYFADLALRERVNDRDTSVLILPPHDLVIFDEAGELDETAAQYFGCQVSDARLFELGRDVSRAFSTGGQQGPRLAKLSGELDLATRKLFAALPFESARLPFARHHVTSAVEARHRRVDELLELLEAELHNSESEEAPTLRRRAATLAAELAFVLFREARGSLLSAVELVLDDVTGPGNPYDQRPDDELTLQPAQVPFVRYTEHRARTQEVVARPLDVAPILSRLLEPVPAIFLSATLAVGEDFGHFRRRMGLDEADELLVASPFDFESQARLYLPDDLPDPNDTEFPERAADRAGQLVAASGGGAFVLCTSNRMIQRIGEILRETTDLEVLTQGDAPAQRLTERFRDHGNAVLVATMSFWRGVDVPGSALRLVVIDRLPFASPNDPIVSARIDYLKRTGVSPFTSYQLPQAALTLRQGFGRLIRRRSDRGLVAILDCRLSTKGYGKLLLRSLPACPRLVGLEEAENYLSSL